MVTTKPWTSRHFVYIFLLGNFLFFFIFYWQPNRAFEPRSFVINETSITNKDEEQEHPFLNPECIIPDPNPWNEEAKVFYKKKSYISCSNRKLLTYVVKNSSSAKLYVNPRAKKSYSAKPITCCYLNVTRSEETAVPDDDIVYSDCIGFKDEVDITDRIVTVKCQSNKKVVYSNTHAPITITEDVQDKMLTFANLTKLETKPLNILIVGIDSISRLNFIRTMPKTREFLINTDWIEYKGYNKIGLNTIPNLMAVLTGKEYPNAFEHCKLTNLGCLDKSGFVWTEYAKLGYVTAFAEDESRLNTFNYYKKGFLHKPVDYYMRPYTVGVTKLSKRVVDRMIYCTGPEASGERILNVAKDFADTFTDYPSFGFFWMNTFSHDELNTPTRMDNKVADFLKNLQESNYSNNSAIIFLSDHGIRFGKIRSTRTGWLEERLPYLYFWFPEWFQKKYPEKFLNFKFNAKSRLTTPYDLYMTLQHMIVLSGLEYDVKPSTACPICKSFFEEIPPRSCEEVNIDMHWCTCYNHQDVKSSEELIKLIGDYVVDKINKKLLQYGEEANKCVKYKLSKILRADTSFKANANQTYVLAIVKTEPTAIFECTLTIENGTITQLNSYLSRIDSYHLTSNCVQNSDLQIYCYCK